MFGIFDGIEKAVSNAIEVGVGIISFGELGDVSKERIAKLVADGVELAIVADLYETSVDVIEQVLEEQNGDA